MAIDVLGFSKMEDQTAIQEAVSAGLKSMEYLIRVLSNHGPSSSSFSVQAQMDCREVTDFTVSKFKQVSHILSRTGHARFRRGPAKPASVDGSQSKSVNPVRSPVKSETGLTMDFRKTSLGKSKSNPFASNTTDSRSELSVASQHSKECFSISPPMSSTSSFMSTITGDGSVSNGKQGSKIVAPPAPAISAGKPPLSSSYRKRCHDNAFSGNVTRKTSSMGGCHCSKRRYVYDFCPSAHFSTRRFL